MPSSMTVQGVYNLALDHIGEFAVSGPADNSPYARWLNRNFAHVVELTLREHPYNFACQFFSLTSVDEMTVRWSYAFDLPSGWLVD